MKGDYQLLSGPGKTQRNSTLAILNKGTDDELECFGYCRSSVLLIIYYSLCILSAGSLLLIMRWKPEWKLRLTHILCSLAKADAVLLSDCYDRIHVAYMQKIVVSNIVPEIYLWSANDDINDELESEEDEPTVHFLNPPVFKYFVHENYRYYWNRKEKTFLPLWGLESTVTCSQIHNEFHGYSPDEQKARAQIFGENSINIEVFSYARLLIEEVLNPFYIFQILSTIFWYVDEYYSYASCIVVISLISITISLYETRKQRVTLRDMVSSSNATEVSVLRNTGEVEVIRASLLVPGDVIIIPKRGCVMSCDAALIAGNCIVNESMLTGESVPVTKTSLSHIHDEDESYSPDVHRRQTLFAGTEVIQTRYYEKTHVTAVVVRTGFSTAKGELVNAILFPKPMDFKFYSDAFKFVLAMGAIATCGMAYGIYAQIQDGEGTEEVILRAIDIITIVVPPSLPAAMTVGTIYAQNRLKGQGIFCISPPRINVSGKLKLFCFDKTGTLTEEGLDLWGIVPVDKDCFQPVVTAADMLPRGPLLSCLATCHSLTVIDGVLSGDPLDMKMFLATKWLLEEPGSDTSRYDSLMPTVVRPPDSPTEAELAANPELLLFQVLTEPGSDTAKYETIAPTTVRPATKESFIAALNADEVPYEIGIVRQFPFSSTLQRMSVITRTLGQRRMDLYVKGAPEKIASLCEDSTVPDDFHETLEQYTIQGFRVIAMGHRKLDKMQWHQAQRVKRDHIERALTFLGLIVMQNTLKPETTPVISELRNSNIRTIMITGDNMHTAISVARDCGMVEMQDRVIIASATDDDNDKPAKITWEYAMTPTSELSDSESETPKSAETFLCSSTTKLTSSYQTVQIDEDVLAPYHLAVSGKSWNVIRNEFPNLVPDIIMKCTVFARMSPEQKVQVVEELQDMGYIVGMCGDGANDCGALKTAHTGISLSEAEASVASPFTSKISNITCVPTVIREGRCALVTSFGIFKYMALYSFIQFISVLILYHYNTNFSDMMFLYIDLVITTTIAVVMGYTKPYHKLVRKRPYGSLVGIPTIFSVISQILIQLLTQIGVWLYLINQPGVDLKPNPPGEYTPVTRESTVIFKVSSFQYLFLAALFSKGPPFRMPFYTNYFLLITLIVLGSYSLMLLLRSPKFITDFMELCDLPPSAWIFPLTLLGFVIANFIISAVIELVIVDSKFLKKCFRLCCKKRGPKNKYKLIEAELISNPNWPPVGDVVYSSEAYNVSSSNTNTVHAS